MNIQQYSGVDWPSGVYCRNGPFGSERKDTYACPLVDRLNHAPLAVRMPVPIFLPYPALVFSGANYKMLI